MTAVYLRARFDSLADLDQSVSMWNDDDIHVIDKENIELTRFVRNARTKHRAPSNSIRLLPRSNVMSVYVERRQ